MTDPDDHATTIPILYPMMVEHVDKTGKVTRIDWRTVEVQMPVMKMEYTYTDPEVTDAEG